MNSKLKTLIFAFTLSILAPIPLAKADTAYSIKVHFLYGSRPINKYKRTERKWFGGKLGGHVGIEIDSNEIINFLPYGAVSLYPNEADPNSQFVIMNNNNFYGVLGGNPDSMKKMVIHLEISSNQKTLLDSITTKYLSKTPYDYAFFGMRCGSSTYDILSTIGILEKFKSNKQLARRIFYPRRLRKRLLKMANEKGWSTEINEGFKKRKWEKD